MLARNFTQKSIYVRSPEGNRVLAEQLCPIEQPIEFKSECSFKRQLQAGNLLEYGQVLEARGHAGGQSVASVVGCKSYIGAGGAGGVAVSRVRGGGSLPGKALSRVRRESGTTPPPRKQRALASRRSARARFYSQKQLNAHNFALVKLIFVSYTKFPCIVPFARFRGHILFAAVERSVASGAKVIIVVRHTYHCSFCIKLLDDVYIVEITLSG